MSIKFLCVTLPHMSIRAGVIIAVTLQQIDNAPDAKTGAQSNDESLQYSDCTVEEFHKVTSLPRLLFGPGSVVADRRNALCLLYVHLQGIEGRKTRLLR